MLLFPNWKCFLSIPVSATDPAAVNPNSIKTPLQMVELHFSLMVTQLSLMAQEVYHEIHLIVLFFTFDFLII